MSYVNRTPHLSRARVDLLVALSIVAVVVQPGPGRRRTPPPSGCWRAGASRSLWRRSRRHHGARYDDGWAAEPVRAISRRWVGDAAEHAVDGWSACLRAGLGRRTWAGLSAAQAPLSRDAGGYACRAARTLSRSWVLPMPSTQTPRTAAELAAVVGADPDALGRMLRLLAAHGVFALHGAVIGHTAASRLLRSDHPQSYARPCPHVRRATVNWTALEALADLCAPACRPRTLYPDGMCAYYAAHPRGRPGVQRGDGRQGPWPGGRRRWPPTTSRASRRWRISAAAAATCCGRCSLRCPP